MLNVFPDSVLIFAWFLYDLSDLKKWHLFLKSDSEILH